MKFPDSTGPGWLYILLAVIGEIEYFQWPLEVLDYLFRPYKEQILLIIDPANLNRWKKRSLTWGGIWSGIAFVAISLYFAVGEFKEYVVSPIFYVVTMSMFAM